MDILSPLLLLLFRSCVILVPLTIAWLAFRRLALSKTGNSWLYALACLLAVVTAAGLMPWALGLKQAGWVFFVLAAFCPAIWIGIITVCDMSQRTVYAHDPLKDAVVTFKSRQKPAPLVLENPEFPGTSTPVFRHQRGEAETKDVVRKPLPVQVAEPTKDIPLIAIARDMRGRPSSDERRPKMLPPPVKSLPFLKN